MTVRELLASTDSREFSEWMAFASLEPFGDSRGDLQAAIMASTVANTARDPKKRRKAFSPSDFLPDFDQPRREQQTTEEQLSIVSMLNAAFGGRDLRDSGG